MNQRDTREWLLTNGLGSFASGTICDAHTRTYHGWLIAALEPPRQRTLLLSRLDASVEIAGQEFPLGVNYWTSGAISPQGDRLLQSFQPEPVPTWIWGQAHWQLCRRLFMPNGLLSSSSNESSSNESSSNKSPGFRNRTLIHYRYEGKQNAVLRLRPLVGDRKFHYQQRQQPDLHFAELLESNRLLIQAKTSTWVGTSWQLSWTAGTYYQNGTWYWGYCYPEETKRGLADQEDLYSPGVLVVSLQPGDAITLEARVRDFEQYQTRLSLDDQTFDQAIASEQERLAAVFAGLCTGPKEEDAENQNQQIWERLLRMGDRFIVHRAAKNRPTMIAGYPWFNEWGRDILIALPGLALTTQRFDLAKGLLRTCSDYCEQGLIPNIFPDSGIPLYNSMDVALWWVETLGLYLEATQDWAFLVEQYPTVWKIYKGLMAGTKYNIRVDAFDGLVTWNAPNMALTWMDAMVADQPVTARRGKPIEVNALWYSALCWAADWTKRLQKIPDSDIDSATLSNQARRYRQQAEQVKASLQKFWNPAQNYLYDTIAPDDSPSPQIRPNAVIALSLCHCAFSDPVGQVVMKTASDRLLTPFGLRSLDPDDPDYVGQYEGGIWQRDRAYHQGTVWSWLIGAFVRGWQRFYPDKPIPFDPQPLLHHIQDEAGLGGISEIFDGDPPHLPRGAISQAWSVAEIIRYWQVLMD
ncbi:MAG TPA: amylo-alpha-1,6-glucosidase [Trichocoleus sp.]|jgi:4-alpha-glucanotransferase